MEPTSEVPEITKGQRRIFFVSAIVYAGATCFSAFFLSFSFLFTYKLSIFGVWMVLFLLGLIGDVFIILKRKYIYNRFLSYSFFVIPALFIFLFLLSLVAPQIYFMFMDFMTFYFIH